MNRSSRSLSLLAALGLALVAADARADKLCVPNANGVPGKGGAPQWTQFDNPAAGNVDPNVDDPRWLGASGHTIRSGSATAPLDYRTLYTTVGSTQYLEMSWQVNVAAFGAAHVLYVGYMLPGVPGSTRMIRFHLPAATSGAADGQFWECNDLDDNCAASCADGGTAGGCMKKQAWYAVYTYSQTCTAGSGTNQCVCDWSSAGVTDASTMVRGDVAPEWIGKPNSTVASTTAWLPSASYTVDSSNRWTVRLRVPIDTSGGTFDMSKGVPPGTQFWYEAPLDILGTDSSPHQQWPRRDAVGSCDTGLEDGSIEMPGPLTFGDVALDPTSYYPGFSPVTDLPAGCAGVSVSSPDIKVIGPDGTPGNTIYGQVSSADFTNVFTATVHNDSTLPVDDQSLAARFRIADWGSQITPWGSEPDYPTGVWNSVPTTNTTTTNPAVLSGAIPPGGTGQLSMSWKLSATERTQYGLGGPAAGQQFDRHECVMVELSGNAGPGSGGNIDFSQRSAYTNMEMGSMSTFEQFAKIAASPQFANKDVYLVMMPKNMDAGATDGWSQLVQNLTREIHDRAGAYGEFTYGGQAYGAYQLGQDARELSEQSQFLPAWLELRFLESIRVRVQQDEKLRKAETLVQVLRQGASIPTLSDILPSVDVYVYVDTGKTFTSRKDHKTHHVLQPMSSFGYDLWHDGAVQDYLQLIDNADKIGPNVYRVHTDKNGNAIVKVVSQAIEPGETPDKQLPKVCGGCCNPKCPTNVGLAETAPPLFAGVFAFRRRKRRKS